MHGFSVDSSNSVYFTTEPAAEAFLTRIVNLQVLNEAPKSVLRKFNEKDIERISKEIARFGSDSAHTIMNASYSVYLFTVCITLYFHTSRSRTYAHMTVTRSKQIHERTQA